MFGYLKCLVLHGLFEIDGSAEVKYKAASEILNVALRASGSQQHRLLHWALDVVLCGGKFDELTVGTDFHRRYWELGHRIASAILQHQENLNIEQVWFENDYPAVLAHLSEANGLLRSH